MTSSIYSTTSNTELVISSSSYDQDSQRITYQLKDVVLANSKVELKMPFSGKLRESSMGYFKSSWEDKGKKKFYSVTQFQVRTVDCYCLMATTELTVISSLPPLDVLSLAGTSLSSRRHSPLH